MQDTDKLFDSLQHQLEGDVLHSELSRSLYSSGASLFRIKPLAIVQAKSTQDLITTMKICQ